MVQQTDEHHLTSVLNLLCKHIDCDRNFPDFGRQMSVMINAPVMSGAKINKNDWNSRDVWLKF